MPTGVAVHPRGKGEMNKGSQGMGVCAPGFGRSLPPPTSFPLHSPPAWGLVGCKRTRTMKLVLEITRVVWVWFVVFFFFPSMWGVVGRKENSEQDSGHQHQMSSPRSKGSHWNTSSK